jgi:hypothetical protein
MEDLKTIHEIYKADQFISADSVVLDLGSSDGSFADWAENKGANVFRIDIRGGKKTLQIAVGKQNRIVKIDGHGTGAHILYDTDFNPNTDTLIQCVTLQTLNNFIGKIDVIKCDIEGSEYEIFEGTELRYIWYIVIEFHAWTEPHQPEIPGLGIRTGEYPKDGFDRLIAWLKQTHTVEVVGDKNSGGYIYAQL